jgi:putative nucleotidyltransferase with HDIG domain
LFASVLLLPFWLFVLLVVLTHAIEWVKERIARGDWLKNWYLQPFNISKVIISGACVYGLMQWLEIEPVSSTSFLAAPATLLLVLVYTFTNQLLLGVAIQLARGIKFRESGVLRDAILIEAPLAGIGYGAIELFARNPLMLLYIFAPIVLIYQAFKLPQVEHEAMQSLKRVNQELTQANQAVRLLNDDLFLTIAKVFDTRDPYVGGHAAQVATYAVMIARELRLSPERVEMIRQCGFLHDIGKIAVPESILNKPSQLSEIEYEFMKKHSTVGADLIASSHGLRHLAPSIRHHHERWDGTGYPLRLAGQMIPLEARILNVCDSVEAMASDRPYHRAMTLPQIIAELKSCSGSQFDPGVVEAFIRIVEREGESFVVNSARTVDSEFAQSIWVEVDLHMQSLKKLYASKAI